MCALMLAVLLIRGPYVPGEIIVHPQGNIEMRLIAYIKKITFWFPAWAMLTAAICISNCRSM